MKRKLFFPLIAALLLVPWPIAYTYDNANAANTPMTIEVTDPSLAPKMNVFGNAIGGVAPGDLFYIDTSGTTADTLFTLYLTNTGELVESFRYMTLNIGIYVQNDTERWEKLNITTAETPPDIYLTMQKGLVTFTLPGCGKYKITVDNGCFYSYATAHGKSAAAPKFYLTSG